VTRFFTLLISFGFVSSLAAQEALTNQHDSSSGYTIRYPGTWKVMDPQALAQIVNDMRAAMPVGVAPGVDVAFIKGNVFDATSLNVVVVDGEMPINEESRQILRGMGDQIGGMMQVRVENSILRDENINGSACLVMQHDMVVMGQRLTQIMFAIPKGQKTYMICGTAKADEFRSVEPTFRMMVASLEVPFLQTIPRWLLWGIIGGIIGGLVGVLGKLFKK
jgi:hypothetical protein